MENTTLAGNQSSYKINEMPFYLAIKDEVEIFERLWLAQISLFIIYLPVKSLAVKSWWYATV